MSLSGPDKVVSELRNQFSEGMVNSFIDILSCTSGGTLQNMYSNPKFVRKAVIQNITTTAGTMVSITTDSSGGNVAVSATNAILLNPGSGANIGGGSLTVDNVDLSSFNWTATNTGDKIAVYYEIVNFPKTGISLT